MLPTAPIWNDLAKWAVPCDQLPAVAHALSVSALPFEGYDPGFQGQPLKTLYFDTPNWDLRKARADGRRYITVRLRCYPGDLYALSAKTEDGKVRWGVDPADAALLLAPGDRLPYVLDILDPPYAAALIGLAGDGPLQKTVCVQYRRYAVEDNQDRLTLDVAVATDTGRQLPYAVLEYKSQQSDPAAHPEVLPPLDLRPSKLSKFLWATGA